MIPFAYWSNKKKWYRDLEMMQSNCKHCMPENSLKGAHICRMYEEKTKYYSVVSGKTKRKIRIICQKCQKESKLEKKYEKHLIAKFTAQITLAEGYELMPENLTDIPVKPQNYNKAKEKLLECENWIKIFQESALEIEELNVQDMVELQSELNIRCSYGLVKCYLFRYLLEKKTSLWINGKKHLDYLESTLPDNESVREIKQLYINNSSEVLATMTETERTTLLQEFTKVDVLPSTQSLQEDRKMEIELNGLIDYYVTDLERILYGSSNLIEHVVELYALHMVMRLSTLTTKCQRNERIDKARELLHGYIDETMQGHNLDYNLYKPSAYEWNGEMSEELEAHLKEANMSYDKDSMLDEYMRGDRLENSSFIPIKNIIINLKDLQKLLGFESNRKPAKGALG